MRSLVAHMSRPVTTIRTKIGPSLRLRGEMAPCVVAELGKEMAITCVLRLTWSHLPQQRGLR